MLNSPKEDLDTSLQQTSGDFKGENVTLNYYLEDLSLMYFCAHCSSISRSWYSVRKCYVCLMPTMPSESLPSPFSKTTHDKLATACLRSVWSQIWLGEGGGVPWGKFEGQVPAGPRQWPGGQRCKRWRPPSPPGPGREAPAAPPPPYWYPLALPVTSSTFKIRQRTTQSVWRKSQYVALINPPKITSRPHPSRLHPSHHRYGNRCRCVSHDLDHRVDTFGLKRSESDFAKTVPDLGGGCRLAASWGAWQWSSAHRRPNLRMKFCSTYLSRPHTPPLQAPCHSASKQQTQTSGRPRQGTPGPGSSSWLLQLTYPAKKNTCAAS